LKTYFGGKDVKNQLVGFKCSGDMLARIDALVLVLGSVRQSLVSASRSDVIREALVLGLKELEEEVETKNLD